MLTRTEGRMTVCQFPCLNDNYGFLIRDEETGVVATVDTPDAQVIDATLSKLGWSLDIILNTHWHLDHTGGNETLKVKYGATVVGPAAEGDRIPGRDRAVAQGDTVEIGELRARVLDTPGHTKGHIVYHFESEKTAFVGDTLFSLGCGRLFEGTAEQMWRSLLSLRNLASDTTLFCAHEYTEANAAFAKSLEPNSSALTAKMNQITSLRANNQPTVPMTLADEKALNPFLRADDPHLAELVGKPGAPAHEVFAEIRTRKDMF